MLKQTSAAQTSILQHTGLKEVWLSALKVAAGHLPIRASEMLHKHPVPTSSRDKTKTTIRVWADSQLLLLAGVPI